MTNQSQNSGPHLRNFLPRQSTRRVLLGGVPIGAGAPVSIQSMVRKSLDRDQEVLEEIDSLARLGCRIVRAALVDEGQLESLRRVCRFSALPLVADVLAQLGAGQIKLSVKSSSPELTLEANRLLAVQSSWPIHLGLTEAGPGLAGAARSATVLGILLSEGIGDTIRVSLSGPAEDEVVAAQEILRALGLVHRGVEIVSCPGCGRAHTDVASAALHVQGALAGLEKPIKVAVMGCEINGPGEAAGADLGIAATARGWLLFSRGRRLGSVAWKEGPERLVELTLELATQVDGT